MMRWEIYPIPTFCDPAFFDLWPLNKSGRRVYIDYKHVPYQINEMTLRDAWQGPISIIYLIVDRMGGAARGCC